MKRFYRCKNEYSIYGKIIPYLNMLGFNAEKLIEVLKNDCIVFFDIETKRYDITYFIDFALKNLPNLGYEEITIEDDVVRVVNGDYHPFPKYMMVDGIEQYVVGMTKGKYIITDKDSFDTGCFSSTLVDNAKNITTIKHMNIEELIKFAENKLSVPVKLKM